MKQNEDNIFIIEIFGLKKGIIINTKVLLPREYVTL